MSSTKIIAVALILATIYDYSNAGAMQVKFSKSFTLSQDVKNYVLGLHNTFRADVAAGKVGSQPKATDLKAMVWDDKIAAFAQEWANKCDLLQHRQGANRTLAGYGTTGENAGMGYLQKAIANDADLKASFFMNIGPTKNKDPMFWGWADEYNYFTYPRTCKSGQMCGHYTQMVWAKSTKIGCGLAQCSGCSKYTGTDLCTNMFCNYIEAGNMQQAVNGQYVQDPPYKSA